MDRQEGQLGRGMSQRSMQRKSKKDESQKIKKGDIQEMIRVIRDRGYREKGRYKKRRRKQDIREGKREENSMKQYGELSCKRKGGKEVEEKISEKERELYKKEWKRVGEQVG